MKKRIFDTLFVSWVVFCFMVITAFGQAWLDNILGVKLTGPQACCNVSIVARLVTGGLLLSFVKDLIDAAKGKT